MPRVFISHSSLDRAAAEREIVAPLRRAGVDTWYSQDDIQTADDWEKSIRRGLHDCDWFLVVLTPHAVRSVWVKIEVNWAHEKRQGRLIPALLKDCDPTDLHMGLSLIQHIDFRRDAEGARARLLAVLKSDGVPRTPPAVDHRSPTRRRRILAASIGLLLFAALSLYGFFFWAARSRPTLNAPRTDNTSAATTSNDNVSGADSAPAANANRQGNRGGPTVTFTPLPTRIGPSNTQGANK